MPSPFFQHESELNGVFNFLHSHSLSHYFILLNVSVSSQEASHIAKHAIDCESSTYWKADNKQEVWLQICFTQNRFLPIGYEIKTSSGDCRPTYYSMSGSNNLEKWEKTVYTEQVFSTNEVYYQEWKNAKPFQCFKFEHLGESQCSKSNQKIYAVDIVQIEFYGTILPLFPITCKKVYMEIQRFLTFFIFIMI